VSPLETALFCGRFDRLRVCLGAQVAACGVVADAARQGERSGAPRLG
jgi:hypothetical protein